MQKENILGENWKSLILYNNQTQLYKFLVLLFFTTTLFYQDLVVAVVEPYWRDSVASTKLVINKGTAALSYPTLILFPHRPYGYKLRYHVIKRPVSNFLGFCNSKGKKEPFVLRLIACLSILFSSRYCIKSKENVV